MPFLGELSALSAAFLWSFSSFLFTNMTIKIGTVQLNTWRLIWAAVLLFFTMMIFNIPYSFNSVQLFYLILSGVVGLVLGDSFLFAAFKEIGPRVGMLVMSSNPAMAAILAYFILKESLSFWAVLGMIITLIGIFIVIMNNTPNVTNRFRITFRGVVFGFLAAVGQAVGLIFAKLAMMNGEINGLTATIIRIVAAAIVILPIGIMTGKMRNPVNLFFKDLKLFGLIILGSIIGPYLGITLSYISIMHTKIGIASTLMSTVPIIMLPLSKMFYKEKLSISAILGAVIAVAGVSILFLR